MMESAGLGISALVPPILVTGGALLVLVLEALASRRRGGGQRQGPRSRRFGLLLAFAASFVLLAAIVSAYASQSAGSFGYFVLGVPMIHADGLSLVAMGLIGVGGLLSIWIASTYLMALDINHGEYHALILLSCAGMFVAVASVHLLALFVGIELMATPVYVLASFDRRRLRGSEAGIKYFLMGAFASAVLLYGMALLYGATGSLGYGQIGAALAQSGAEPGSLAMAGVALMLSGLALKLGLAPFHQWVPDVYEGAPTPVAAFLAVAVKTTAAVVLIRWLTGPVAELAGALVPIFQVLAGLSIIVGNLMAMVQHNVKRMLAYSSVAHAGYLALAFVTSTPEAHAALLFYLIAYLFATVGAFGVVSTLSAGGRDCERIEDLAGVARHRPELAVMMTLFVLSLAGIPGTAGFFAKFQLFGAAIGDGQLPLVLIGVLGSVASLYYYLRLPIAMFMRDARGTGGQAEPSTNELLALLACALATLVLGIDPDLVLGGLGGGVLTVLRTAVGAG